MLDADLAALYDVPTKRLNEAVKRNVRRFPETFMFRLSGEEAAALRSQNATLETGRGRYSKYSPLAFTEHGVVMLSSVLNSERAAATGVPRGGVIRRVPLSKSQACPASNSRSLRLTRC